jgi:hypothetical protein
MPTLIAPKSLCIYNNANRPKTIKFLSDIDLISVNDKSRYVIDLSGVEYAGAAASVLLFAKINRAQLRYKNPNLFRFKWPKKNENPLGHRWIIGTGLSKALLSGNLEKIDILTRENQFFQSSVEPYQQLISTVVMLQRNANLTEEQLKLLISAVSEAMLNVSHHAYEDEVFSEQVTPLGGKRWWQCSWFNPEENSLVFIICDLGIGLGRSFQQADIAFSRMGELNCVLTALTVGESRFRGAGRGNGSEDIKRPIGSGCAESETLLVFTGNARYSYTSLHGSLTCEPVKEFIPGTLIEWTLVPRREE